MVAQTLQPEDALMVVDVQNDFLPGGALAVPRGDGVIAPLNRVISLFRQRRLPVIFTRDWHPADHCSFRAQGGPWPPHCIAGTPGAAFAPALLVAPDDTVISKAITPDKDAYSGFEGTGLEVRLRAPQVKRLVVGGLATDYCVLNTVRDALRLGFAVLLLEDAVRAVDVTAGDGERAIEEMRRLGAVLSDSKSLA